MKFIAPITKNMLRNVRQLREKHVYTAQMLFVHKDNVYFEVENRMKNHNTFTKLWTI